jgi:threonine/homoserine/homoserine lactone efflux protein
MTYEILTAFILFAWVTSVTPGPNNMMLMASGANFGLRATVPHMLGVSLGHAVMVFILGMGLIEVFDAVPASYLVLKVISVAYLLWLAWKIATAAGVHGRSAGARPLTFLQAAAFQWVNPKAWAMALGAVAAYAPDQSWVSVSLIAVIFASVNLPSVGVWAILGQQLTRILTAPRHLRMFNWTMAGLLVLSLYPVLMGV